ASRNQRHVPNRKGQLANFSETLRRCYKALQDPPPCNPISSANIGPNCAACAGFSPPLGVISESICESCGDEAASESTFCAPCNPPVCVSNCCSPGEAEIRSSCSWPPPNCGTAAIIGTLGVLTAASNHS